MPSGRCAGCGFIASSTKAAWHILGCAAYADLYRTDRARCLDPADEFVRFKADDDTREARALARDQRLAGRFAELDELAARQAVRWATPADILDD